MNLAKTIQRMYEPWLCEARTHYAMMEALRWVANLPPDQGGKMAKTDGSEPDVGEIEGVAILPLQGTLMKNPSQMERAYLGATNVDLFTKRAQNLHDENEVDAVIVDIDSGGGSVAGVMEAAGAIAEMGKKKPVITYTGGVMGSGAYWIGSQASTLVASPSARAGAVGVYVPVLDTSERAKMQGVRVEVIRNRDGIHKGAGYEGTTLSDEQREQIQGEVEEIYGNFKKAVAKRSLKAEVMQGQTFLGATAKQRGIVDVIGSLNDGLKLAHAEVKRMGRVDTESRTI